MKNIKNEVEIISELIHKTNIQNISQLLFHLSKDPLPCRTLNFTLPGHLKSTLHETDDFIKEKLEIYHYQLETEAVPVQAFQPVSTVSHGFRKPFPTEPWYTAYNLYAKKQGTVSSNEVIIIVAHKDSQSWLEGAPGAHDNAVGTSASLEIARILKNYSSQRSIWFLFCNEEHWPWTSETAAQKITKTDLNIIAVINLDSLGGKSSQDRLSRNQTNVTRFSTSEGEKLTDLTAILNEKYGIGLQQQKYYAEHPNDDDGSFIKAGIPAAIMNIGSFPYADPNYHSMTDTPEQVDLENVTLATQLSLALILHLDLHGGL